jgi:magnesium chelatase family protein
MNSTEPGSPEARNTGFQTAYLKAGGEAETLRLKVKNAAFPECFCAPDEVYRYWRKIGAPLLDRIELRVPVLPRDSILSDTSREDSQSIARRVCRAVEIQRFRYKNTPVRRNSRMTPALIERFCALDSQSRHVFTLAAEHLALSGRACHTILKTARTIADLETSETIKQVHLLEAIEHRRLGSDPYDIITLNEK